MSILNSGPQSANLPLTYYAFFFASTLFIYSYSTSNKNVFYLVLPSTKYLRFKDKRYNF